MVLIMTLMVIAIVTVLLLALFEGSAIVAQEDLLADSATSLVEGQIAQAASQTNQTWMSQPGLVRTNTVRKV